MANHIMLKNLRAADIPDTKPTRVVRERDCEGFDVQRMRGHYNGAKGPAAMRYYVVANRTFWPTGDKAAITLADVRKLITGAS